MSVGPARQRLTPSARSSGSKSAAVNEVAAGCAATLPPHRADPFGAHGLRPAWADSGRHLSSDSPALVWRDAHLRFVDDDLTCRITGRADQFHREFVVSVHEDLSHGFPDDIHGAFVKGSEGIAAGLGLSVRRGNTCDPCRRCTVSVECDSKILGWFCPFRLERQGHAQTRFGEILAHPQSLTSLTLAGATCESNAVVVGDRRFRYLRHPHFRGTVPTDLNRGFYGGIILPAKRISIRLPKRLLEQCGFRVERLLGAHEYPLRPATPGDAAWVVDARVA